MMRPQPPQPASHSTMLNSHIITRHQDKLLLQATSGEQGDYLVPDGSKNAWNDIK